MSFSRNAVISLLFFGSSLLAQSTRISGRVTDVTGAVVPGTPPICPTLSRSDRITSNPPSPFELPRHSSFDYDLEALPTGQIRGHVVGPDGKPLTTASVALYRAEGFAPGGAGLFTSQVEGKPFDFLHLPPGDYLVVFTGTSPDAPFPPTFYPDAPDSQAATAIHLSDGQQMSDVEIHVKGAIPTRNITVRLHWNGRTFRLLSASRDRGGQRREASSPL